MGGVHEGETILEFYAQPARGARVIVQFENGTPKGAVSTGRFLSQGCFLRGGRGFASNGGELRTLLREIPGDQGLPQLVPGMGIGEEPAPQVVVETPGKSPGAISWSARARRCQARKPGVRLAEA